MIKEKTLNFESWYDIFRKIFGMYEKYIFFHSIFLNRQILCILWDCFFYLVSTLDRFPYTHVSNVYNSHKSKFRSGLQKFFLQAKFPYYIGLL